MDILGADDMKWTMRIIAKYAQKELEKEMRKKYSIPGDKKFIEFIHDDLQMCPNQAIRKIYKNLLIAGEAMPTNHHSSLIVDLGSFLIWVAFKDTAYRDPLFWIMNEIVTDPDFKKDIKEFVKDPKDWYCPQWIASQKETEKLRKEGKISEHDLSPSEKKFVPFLQIDKIGSELKKQIEQEKYKHV